MRAATLTLALMLTAMPALAGGMGFDLPNLTWPQQDTATTSTKGCELDIQTPKADARACK